MHAGDDLGDRAGLAVGLDGRVSQLLWLWLIVVSGTWGLLVLVVALVVLYWRNWRAWRYGPPRLWFTASAWVECSCGKVRWVRERAETQRLADMMLDLARGSVCSSCSTRHQVEMFHCPEYAPATWDGRPAGPCVLPFDHVGRCEPMADAHADVKEQLRSQVAAGDWSPVRWAPAAGQEQWVMPLERTHQIVEIEEQTDGA